MQRRQQLLLSFMVWGLVLFYGTTVVAVPTSQEIAKIALGSTVHLGIIRAKGGSTGSGFFVGPNQIATNYHVIEDILNEYTIRGAKLVGKDDIYAIEDVVSFDKKKDLAIIKVSEGKGTDIEVPALTLGDSDAVQIGEKIYVAGNPQGLEGTFSDGIISAIRGDSTDDKLFQMTAPISQGSSGGPVLNQKGEVIGVSVATLRDGQNLNFAIPVNYLKALMPTPPPPVKPKPVKPKIDPPPVKPKPTKPQAAPPPTEPKPTPAPQEIAKTALGSTVHLSVRDAEGESWTGSGFVVDDDQIATNYHVIDNMSVGGVRLVGKEEIYPIEAILAGDKERDLAIIKVAGINAPALPLGDSDTVEVMDTIYVAGNPQGLEGTVVPGHISAIRQSRDRLPLKFFQMTAPISQGSSGGPVCNKKGEVIGISFATVLDGQNLNFAIPVNYLKALMPTPPTPPVKPKVDPPFARPIVKHDAPSKISIGEIIPLTLDLISSQAPQQVTIHYKTYDRNGNKLEQNNQKMRLGDQQSASSTRAYKVDLPAQKQVGSIEYYITVEYQNNSIFRQPSEQSRHYEISIVDGRPPKISLLYPPPDATFGANQEVIFRAEVTDNTAIKDVHIHISSRFNDPQSYKLTAKGSSDIYTIPITFANIITLQYHLTATDEEGNESRSEYRHIEIRITSQENFEKGIKLYEQARYSEAIKALSTAVRELKNPKQRAEACLYLGGSKRGIGEGNDKVREQFQESIRHNPDQELPPRLGKDHPIFAELIEEVRKELTGELTVISLLPETEIWIEGNEVERKMLGTGIVKRRLLTGDYTVEGIYERGPKRIIVTIESDRHKELNLGIPPTVEHDPPPKISVGERIPLTLDLISTKSPQQVKIHYKTYDRDNNQLEQNNQEMSLWGQQSASSTWVYKVDLPARNHMGSIEYCIEIEYESQLVFKYPSTESRYYQIPVVDQKPPTIFVLYPPDGAKFKRDQKITIRAKVRASHAIKAVHVHFSSGSRQKMSQEKSSDVYAARITVSGSLRYYLIVTDEAGNTSESESRRIEIKTEETSQGEQEEPTESPTPPVDPPRPPQGKPDPPIITSAAPASPTHQGIWAIVSAEAASTFAGDGSYMFGLAYLREGRNQSTLGAQLNFFLPDYTNVSAMVQWGPRPPGKTKATFTLLGGIAAYEDSHQPTHTTPIFGGGVKLYPRDRIVIDATGSIQLRQGSDTLDLYHYKVGIRLYITRELSLRAGYGQFFLDDQNVSTIQVGLGYTF